MAGEIAEKLRLYRCNKAQGYHFARPMPAAEFERYFGAGRIA